MSGIQELSSQELQTLEQLSITKTKETILFLLKKLAKQDSLDASFSSKIDTIVSQSFQNNTDEAKSENTEPESLELSSTDLSSVRFHLPLAASESKLDLSYNQSEELEANATDPYISKIKSFSNGLSQNREVTLKMQADKGNLVYLSHLSNIFSFYDAVSDLEADQKPLIVSKNKLFVQLHTLSNMGSTEAESLKHGIEQIEKTIAEKEKAIAKLKKENQEKPVPSPHNLRTYVNYLKKCQEELKTQRSFVYTPKWVTSTFSKLFELITEGDAALTTLEENTRRARNQNEEFGVQKEIETQQAFHRGLRIGSSVVGSIAGSVGGSIAASQATSRSNLRRASFPASTSQFFTTTLQSFSFNKDPQNFKKIREALAKDCLSSRTLCLLDGLLLVCGQDATLLEQANPSLSSLKNIHSAYPLVTDAATKVFLKDAISNLILGLSDVETCLQSLQRAATTMVELKALYEGLVKMLRGYGEEKDTQPGLPKLNQAFTVEQAQAYHKKAKIILNAVSKGYYLPIFQESSQTSAVVNERYQSYKQFLASKKGNESTAAPTNS